jgi:isopenicillin N synthase-like dioxygenase
VLLQDGVGSLQVIVEDEKLQPVWVDVPAVAGTLIVNIGDFLQLISNDRFKSVEHRVVSKSVGPRVSVACFFLSHGAASSTRVYGPIIPEGDPSPERSTRVEEMLRHFREKGLDGSSALQHFRV